MAERPREPQLIDELQVDSDRVASLMRVGILFLIICILCVVVYAFLVGVIFPQAPRTLAESSLAQAQIAVEENPGNGLTWSALAGAQYATGDTEGAWATLSDARMSVKDRSILLINTRELEFLLLEGKDEEAVERADEFIEIEANYQLQEKADNAGQGVTVPDQLVDNTEAVRLFVLKGTALGNLERWDEAIEIFDLALEVDDKAADIITLRGWAKLNAGDTEGARDDFELALKYLPGDPSATAGLEKVASDAE